MRNKTILKIGLVCACIILLTAVSTAQTQYPPVGHWTFDEGSGQVAYDSAGNNDGTLGSTSGSDRFDPSWTNGFINGALFFAGSYGDYVQVPHDSSLNRNTISMTAWVYWEGEDPSDDVIMAKEGSYKLALDEDDGELKAGINGGCPGYGWCDDGGNGWLYSDYDIPEKEWTHVAAVWDGTHINFYVNGDRVKRHQPSEVSSHTDIVDTTRDLGIGARGVDARPHSFFYGKLDDVRIYEEPLTEDDFQDGDTDDDGVSDCNNRCSPTTIYIYNVTENTYNTENNYYNYTYNYDYTTYNYTYNDYAYNTYNNYNYTFNDYEYNYFNKEYYNYTTIYDQDTTYNYNYTTNNEYNQNTYNYENNYDEDNTYIYYNFGGDCPDSGCQYVCQTQNCDDQLNGDGDAPVLTNNVDLEIIEAAYPQTISAGQQVPFRITIRNQGELNANDVTLSVRAYGQLKEVEHLELRSGRQKNFTVLFNVPQSASGPEDVQLEAVALNSQGNVMERDLATVPIEARDIHLTMHLQPQRVVVGDPVTVSGQMSQANLDARLYVDGFYIATVTSDETKHYSHSILTQEPGVFRVELRAGNARKTSYLRVDPKIGIINTNIPETVNTRNSFQACATVFSATQRQTTLRLLVDGQMKDAATMVVQGERQHCFQTNIGQEGKHDVTFRVESGNVADERTQTVNVIESRIEVNVFPQEVTLEKGHSGLFQVKIQNEDAQSRTYHIQVSGLSGITETTDKQVALGSGETRTVFIRVVPPETGLYTGNITVSSDSFIFADTQVRIFANENPALKGPLSRAGAVVRDAASYVVDRAAAIGIGLGVLIVLGVLGVLIYRRAKRSDVIEPRY